jgi:hypothetical protein
MAVRSALCAGHSLPPGTFLVLISVRDWIEPRAIVRLEGLGEIKNPIISSGIEPATFRLQECSNIYTHRHEAFKSHMYKWGLLVARRPSRGGCVPGAQTEGRPLPRTGRYVERHEDTSCPLHGPKERRFLADDGCWSQRRHWWYVLLGQTLFRQQVLHLSYLPHHTLSRFITRNYHHIPSSCYLDWGFLMFSSIPSGKFRDNTSN